MGKTQHKRDHEAGVPAVPMKGELDKETQAQIRAFRKLPADEQMRSIRGEQVERTFQVERDGIDQEARTAWLSIASERPYERWWGIEVLDHKKQSIRDERLRAGAALLVGHDPGDQVGVVEKFEITAQKKLRILARFGRSARAEEIWQDVLDGIRRNTSVGYIIHDLVLEKSEEGINTYRVTDWEPLEGSLVSIPADPSVGLGRQHAHATEQKDTPMPLTQEEKDKIAADARATAQREAEEAAERETAREQVRQAEMSRINAIMAAGREFADLGGNELAAELIKEGNATVETFKARMLDKQRDNKHTNQRPVPEDGKPTWGSEGRHIIMRGQKLRAFTQPLRFNDGSKMEPMEAAYRSGQWLMALVTGSQRAHRWCKENGLGDYLQQRVMTGDVDSAGGYLIPTEMEQAIIDLREDYGLARRLCRRRPMATDTKSVPKRAGGVTAYFIEEDNEGITASDKSWGNVNFVAKTLAALSLISENLEEDSIIDVVDDLAREQAYAMATKEDQCWLIGDGTSTYGGMQGLRTMFDATAYASRVTAASNHDTFAEYDNADLSAVMAGVADFPGINPVWLCSKTFAENVFGRLQRTAGGNTGGDLNVRARYGYGGYEAYTSEIMPKTGTSAVTTVEAFFGDFMMSSSFGDRRGIMIKILRERYAEKLQVGIRGHERFHIINHDVGTTAVKGPVAALKAE